MWRKARFGARWGLDARWAAILVAFVCILETNANIDLANMSKKPQRCSYHKAYGMNGAYCSGLNLHSVPTTLKTDIEILDLSTNRIRDLRNNTFAQYSSVRFLYLSDNIIYRIEKNAFAPLSSLEVLDLSLNNLHTIPEYVLQLPLLRKLYMAENDLLKLDEDLRAVQKPIAAPLEFLNVANCELSVFPDFGILPNLENLNVSGNRLRDLSAKDFAKMCGLKAVDLTDSFHSEDVCALKQLAAWFGEKRIVTVPEMFSVYNPNAQDKKQCTDNTMDDQDEMNYQECTKMIKLKEAKKAKKKTWIIVGSCLGGFLFIGICFLYIMHRRNAKQAAMLAMQEGNTEKFINK